MLLNVQYEADFHSDIATRSRLSDIVADEIDIQRGQVVAEGFLPSGDNHVSAEMSVNAWLPDDANKDFGNSVLPLIKESVNNAQIFGMVVLIKWTHLGSQPDVQRVEVPSVPDGKVKTTLIIVLTAIFIMFGGSTISLCVHYDYDYEKERRKRLNKLIPDFSKRAYKAASQGVNKVNVYQRPNAHQHVFTGYQTSSFSRMDL